MRRTPRRVLAAIALAASTAAAGCALDGSTEPDPIIQAAAGRLIEPAGTGTLGYFDLAGDDAERHTDLALYVEAIALTHTLLDPAQGATARTLEASIAQRFENLEDEGITQSNPVDIGAAMLTASADAQDLDHPVYATAIRWLRATAENTIAAVDPAVPASYVDLVPHIVSNVVAPDQAPAPECDALLELLAPSAGVEALVAATAVGSAQPTGLAACTSGVGPVLDDVIAAAPAEAALSLAYGIDDLQAARLVSPVAAGGIRTTAAAEAASATDIGVDAAIREIAFYLATTEGALSAQPAGYAARIPQFLEHQNATILLSPSFVVMFDDIAPAAIGSDTWAEWLDNLATSDATEPAVTLIANTYLDRPARTAEPLADSDAGLGHFGWLFALGHINSQDACEQIDQLGLSEVSLAVAEAVDELERRCPDSVLTRPDTRIAPLDSWATSAQEASWGPGATTRYRCLLTGDFNPPPTTQVVTDDPYAVWTHTVITKGACP